MIAFESPCLRLTFWGVSFSSGQEEELSIDDETQETCEGEKCRDDDLEFDSVDADEGAETDGDGEGPGQPYHEEGDLDVHAREVPVRVEDVQETIDRNEHYTQYRCHRESVEGECRHGNNPPLWVGS